MSTASIFVSQARYQMLANIRAGSAIAVGIIMPVVFYLGASALFGSAAMGGDSPVEVRGAGEAPDLRTFYVGGFMAYAALYAAFVALLPELVDVRERGLLKRLRGTPLPLSAFVAARFAIVLAITMIGVVAIALCGWAVFGVATRVESLVALVVYTLAGTVAFVCLGFAATTITRSVSGAQGLSNGIGVILAMISGVFFAPTVLPDAARNVARFLPLEPLASGYQSLYVNDASGVGLDAGNLGVLGAWALAAIGVVVVAGFRWKPRQQR
ncbi:MAG: ABC transporter permease [Actinomycetota bacterium]|nr:ABC transporter permease [Actinomycetota bacterium]MDA3016028.1 ABC transporter permease [Actinomycetota bacterium]MDA3029353.1 ABC transporter permease [Actinomycetota bacterium]